ncbi:MAG: hypothetical protein HY062_13620 [Bacteroidetes bacterium]|nr:hypothetical protein [Bacteroidota bacterium]
MKIIETKIAKITLLDNGIIRIQGNSDINITLDDMFENDEAFKHILPEGNAPFLTIFGENATINLDAQMYFANKQRSKIKKAEALLTSQMHHRLIALTHTTHLMPSYPIRHFTVEEEAIKWLLTFI